MLTAHIMQRRGLVRLSHPRVGESLKISFHLSRLHTMIMMNSPTNLLLMVATAIITNTNAFISSPTREVVVIPQQVVRSSSSIIRRTKSSKLHQTNGSPDAPKTIEEDAALQWGLFTKHHAVDHGEWWGTWSTYNYMGDLEDSTVSG